MRDVPVWSENLSMGFGVRCVDKPISWLVVDVIGLWGVKVSVHLLYGVLLSLRFQGECLNSVYSVYAGLGRSRFGCTLWWSI